MHTSTGAQPPVRGPERQRAGLSASNVPVIARLWTGSWGPI